MAEVLGLSIAQAIWDTLASSYSHNSTEHMQNLKDFLHQLQKGTSYISEYRQKFKSLFDELAATSEPVEEIDETQVFM